MTSNSDATIERPTPSTPAGAALLGSLGPCAERPRGLREPLRAVRAETTPESNGVEKLPVSSAAVDNGAANIANNQKENLVTPAPTATVATAKADSTCTTFELSNTASHISSNSSSGANGGEEEMRLALLVLGDLHSDRLSCAAVASILSF